LTGTAIGARITVVIPAWGEYAGAWLDSSLSSLAAQGVPIEVLVVDNASAPPVAERPGATLVRLNRRLALGAARNAGLAQVQTPLVLFWDADDRMLEGTLSALSEALERVPGAVLAWARIVEDADGTPHHWPRPYGRRIARYPALLRAAQAVWSTFPTTGAVLIRTEAALACGGFGDAESGDDWVLGVSLAFRGRVVAVDHPGRLYLRRPGSVWARHSTSTHLRRHAAAVRARLRADPAVPAIWRVALPVLWALQTLAISLRGPFAWALSTLGARRS
jgi:glycosyltransferase involved in cell wall biosynthesis